jgi:hypothetical protein
MPRKQTVVTPRIAGPVDIGGTRFPLSRGMTLDYVQGVHRLVFDGESFLIVLYGAWNAGGLIGTEHNGIAVLEEDYGRVALMDHARDQSYMKASDRQRREYDRICGMDAVQFRSLLAGPAKALEAVERRQLAALKAKYEAPDTGGTT